MVTTENFVANVQYDDWTGTSAADDWDPEDIQQWLKNQCKLRDDDRLCGIQIHVVEGTTHISALIVESHNDEITSVRPDDGEPLPVKKLEFKLSLSDFVNKFKRFNVKLSFRGCLTDRTIKIVSTEEWAQKST